MRKTDTSNLTLVNYCHPACEPMRNIIRLPKAEAFDLAARLAAENSGIAFNRFADFPVYYELRVRQDAYLRRAFIEAGGCPIEAHPLSFALEGSAYLREWFGGGPETRILLADIAEPDISFTIGDSGAAIDHGRTPRVLTKNELLRELGRTDGGLAGFLAERAPGCHYIEAQLWNDKYIQDAARPCKETRRRANR